MTNIILYGGLLEAIEYIYGMATLSRQHFDSFSYVSGHIIGDGSHSFSL